MLIQRISESTSIDSLFIRKIVAQASHLYKVYEVPKRSGKGTRLIHHPSRELKFFQRWLVDNILIYLPVHDCVYSYRSKRNIKHMAHVHRAKKYMLRADFKDFFHSLRGTDLEYFLKKNASLIPFSLSNDDLKVICSLVCKNDRLTIGAPSSPAISNALLYEFDSFWWSKCHKLSVVYSRYADDLYFSTNKSKTLAGLLSELREDLKSRKLPYLSLNDDKTVFTSRKHKRLVTGLVLTTENKVSIGRIKKRRIKSMIYNFKKNNLTDDDVSYLRGYIAFINAVEPKFVETLGHKYGSETIEAIMKKSVISKK